GEGKLCRAAAALARQAGKRPVAQNPALLDRGVGHDADAVLRAPGQHIPFDAAACQVVEHLIGGGRGAELLHLACVEIAHAPMADLAGALERGEGLERLRKRDAAAPMKKVEIEPVGAEALEARVASLGGFLAARILRQDLADEKHPVSAPPSPYISAVSMRLMPRSRPSFNALTSPAASRVRSPIIQVPRPRTGNLSPP